MELGQEMDYDKQHDHSNLSNFKEHVWICLTLRNSRLQGFFNQVDFGTV